MNELTSIIIPVYNSETTLKRCIDSLLSQSYLNIEIIIVNDGSTDLTSKILDGYKEYEKIMIINKKNEGVSVARNIGIKKCKGQYVAFSDSDDYWEKDGIELLVDSIKRTKSDLAIGSYYLVSRKKEKITFLDKEQERYSIEEYMERLAKGTVSPFFGSQCNKLYKLEIIKNIMFKESENFAEDFLFNLDILKKIKNISYVEKPVYSYIITDKVSLSQFRYEMIDHWEKFKYVYRNFYDLYCEKNIVEKYEKELSNFLFLGVNLVISRAFTYEGQNHNKNFESIKEIIEDEILNDAKMKYITNFRYLPIKIGRKYSCYKLVYAYYFFKRKIRILIKKFRL